jgi:hypothetical protein
MITANDFISDNLTMTGPDQGSSSPLRRILRAPFTRRTWDTAAAAPTRCGTAACAGCPSASAPSTAT